MENSIETSIKQGKSPKIFKKKTKIFFDESIVELRT